MINLATVQTVLGIYAALLAAGGVLGYVKAGSKPSLIAGLASAALATLALGLSFLDSTLGIGLACVVALLLGGFFGYRFGVKTRKFMPAGLLSVLSAVVLVMAILALL